MFWFPVQNYKKTFLLNVVRLNVIDRLCSKAQYIIDGKLHQSMLVHKNPRKQYKQCNSK